MTDERTSWGDGTISVLDASGEARWIVEPRGSEAKAAFVSDRPPAIADDDAAWLRAPLTPRERASTNLKGKRIVEW